MNFFEEKTCAKPRLLYISLLLPISQLAIILAELKLNFIRPILLGTTGGWLSAPCLSLAASRKQP